VLRAVRKELAAEFPQTTAQLFSVPAKTGVDEARVVLAQWLAL